MYLVATTRFSVRTYLEKIQSHLIHRPILSYFAWPHRGNMITRRNKHRVLDKPGASRQTRRQSLPSPTSFSFHLAYDFFPSPNFTLTTSNPPRVVNPYSLKFTFPIDMPQTVPAENQPTSKNSQGKGNLEIAPSSRAVCSSPRLQTAHPVV